MTITLNNIIDDLILTIRNGQVSDSENISKYQVELWIDTYRAMLIKQDIDKDKYINDEYIQVLTAVPVMPIDGEHPNGVVLETGDLPKLIILNGRPSVIQISDIYGNPIQYSDRTKAQFQNARRWGSDDYIAYWHNGKIRVQGPGFLEAVDIKVIAENPSSAFKDDCDYADMPYPMPIDKIPALKELIFAKELGIRLNLNSDVTNDQRNDLAGQNNASQRVLPSKRNSSAL